MVIIWKICRFRHYLLGSLFTLQTDHKPIMWLEFVKESHARSQRLERSVLELQNVENVDVDSCQDTLCLC